MASCSADLSRATLSAYPQTIERGIGPGKLLPTTHVNQRSVPARGRISVQADSQPYPEPLHASSGCDRNGVQLPG